MRRSFAGASARRACWPSVERRWLSARGPSCAARAIAGAAAARRPRDPRARDRRPGRRPDVPARGRPKARRTSSASSGVMGPGLADAVQHRRRLGHAGRSPSARCCARRDASRSSSRRTRASTPSSGPALFARRPPTSGRCRRSSTSRTSCSRAASATSARSRTGLGTAGAGAVQLQGGLERGRGGARASSGRRRPGAGRRRQAPGPSTARAGSAKISGGSGSGARRANELKDGSGQALAGAKLIAGGLGTAVEPVKPACRSSSRWRPTSAPAARP